MEEIYLKVLQALQELTDIALVDEDYGQLETDDDTYPLSYPALLIGELQAEWRNKGMAGMTADISFITRLAIDCYDDTHRGSTTEELIAERQQMAQQVADKLQGLRISDDIGRLTRIRSRHYTLRSGIKIYEDMWQNNSHRVK